jgi:hypothetical protein
VLNFPSELVAYEIPSVSTIERLGDDERFARSTSLAVCLMTFFVSFPSEWFELNKPQASPKMHRAP